MSLFGVKCAAEVTSDWKVKERRRHKGGRVDGTKSKKLRTSEKMFRDDPSPIAKPYMGPSRMYVKPKYQLDAGLVSDTGDSGQRARRGGENGITHSRTCRQ